MLAKRRRRWADSEQILVQRIVKIYVCCEMVLCLDSVPTGMEKQGEMFTKLPAVVL